MKTPMKKCPNCKRELSLDNFGKDHRRSSGLRIYCKECQRRQNRESYQRNLVKARQQKRAYAATHREEQRARSARWYRLHSDEHYLKSAVNRKAHPERGRIYDRRWRERHPDKDHQRRALYNAHHTETIREIARQTRKDHPEWVRAHKAVAYALKTGKLTRSPTCQHCGKKRFTHAHHDDYQRQLDVLWLCARCHRQLHVERANNHETGTG